MVDLKTLLLRLEGPMQSWGTTSRFTERDTGFEPSKSGVIGLLCAALGKPRHEIPEHVGRWPSLKELCELRMGVRIDRPGKVGVDFQTAGGGRLGGRTYGVAKADGSKPESVMSWRYFLQDASFLVGLESFNDELLQTLHEALRRPVWPLYLGRKSYVPGVPVYLPDGLQNGRLEDVLAGYGEASGKRVVVDEGPEAERGEVRVDVPVDFARRRFGPRYVRSYTIDSPTREG